MKTKTASPELEAFYRESMEALAFIARKHGDKASVGDMISVLGKAMGRFVVSCVPKERNRARRMAINNMDEEIKTFAKLPLPFTAPVKK